MLKLLSMKMLSAIKTTANKIQHPLLDRFGPLRCVRATIRRAEGLIGRH